MGLNGLNKQSTSFFRENAFSLIILITQNSNGKKAHSTTAQWLSVADAFSLIIVITLHKTVTTISN
jgi:hypothetical protein